MMTIYDTSPGQRDKQLVPNSWDEIGWGIECELDVGEGNKKGRSMPDRIDPELRL